MMRRHPANMALQTRSAEMIKRLQMRTVEPELDAPVLSDTNLRNALANMQDVAYCRSEAFVEKQWTANFDGVDGAMYEFAEKLIRKMASSYGVPLFARCAMRTAAEQRQAHERGVTKTLRSAHMVGCAVDIVHCQKAWALSRMQWSLIGHVGKEVAKKLSLRLEWGGDWQYYDPAHWELKGWKARK